MTAKEQLLRAEELIEAILNLLRSVKAQSSQNSILKTDSTQVIPSPPQTNQSLLDLLNDFEQFAESIPPEELMNLHTDSAEQHDHYLYQTPKNLT